MQEAAVDLHGIVVADRPSILKATDAVEVGGGRLPGRFRLRGGPGEASVVAWDEAIKDALRLREGAGLREPQFDDQPIVESTEEPLDPSFIRYEIVWYPEPSAEVAVCRGGMVRPSG